MTPRWSSLIVPIANYRDRADIRAEVERNENDTHDLCRVYTRADDFDSDFGVVLDDLSGVVLHPTQQKRVRRGLPGLGKCTTVGSKTGRI